MPSSSRLAGTAFRLLFWLSAGAMFVSGRAAPAAFPLATIEIRSSAPSGVAYDPAASIEQVLVLKNLSTYAVSLDRASFRVFRTRALVGTPESIWDSRFANLEQIAAGPLLNDTGAPRALAPGATMDLPVRFVPGKYGLFSVMVFLRPDDEGYRAATVAVVYAPLAGRQPDSPLLTTASNKLREGDFTELPLLARLGMKWVRYGLAPEIDARGNFDWSRVDRIAAAFRQNDLLMLTDLTQWEGRSPAIGGKPVAYFGARKINILPRPEDFGLFGDQVETLVRKYHDVVPAGYVRNEPWEGGSISFYHATGEYYREWLKVAAAAAHRGAPGFSVLADDAITNFEDNIQMSGAERFVDITSHHSDIAYNRGAVQSAVLGKPAWETEDWMSHYDAYLVANLTMKLAHGYAKSNPGDAGLYTTNPGQSGRRTWNYWSKGPTMPSPAGQAVSIWLHFVEGMKFQREINPDCLPWIFLFSRSGAGEVDNVAVVIGRIKAYGYGYKKGDGDIAHPAVTAFGELQIADEDHALSAWDFSGNPLAAGADGTLVVPLNEDAHYVVSAKGADDLAQKLGAARAKYAGSGFQMSMLDFTRPLPGRPPVRVSVTNAVQATMDAVVRLTPPPGWRLVAERQTLLAMRPGESRALTFDVAESRENSVNSYPFTLQVSSPSGTGVITEDLHVALFRRGTISVDGDLADWQKIGAVPVILGGRSSSDDAVEKYWYPFLKSEGSRAAATQVRFAGAWDDEYFYVCAEIQDPTEHLRPSMAHGVYYATHGNGLDYLYWGVPAFPGTVGDALKIAFDLHRPGTKRDSWLPPVDQRKIDGRFDGLSADYEYDLYLGAQQKIEPDYPTVLARHLERLRRPPDDAYRGPWPPFEDPTFVDVGPPLPEIWRLMAPGVPRHNYYPFSARRARDQGLVRGAKLVVKRDGPLWRYEAAIPWSELAEVHPTAGQEVRFGFYVINDGKRTASWAEGRSAGQGRSQILHPTWLRNDAIETVWSFQDAVRR